MSEKVNPNVESAPVDGATLQKAPGESVNFDQMESLMDQDGRSPQVERQSTNEPQRVEAEEPAEKKGRGQGKEDQVEEPVGFEATEKDPKDQKVKQEREPAESLEEEIVEGDEKSAKIYKVKQGESELDLRADTEFEVMVKGAPEKVNLQDMMNNYSGKQSWDRKFSDLDKERKTFESDRETLNETVNTMYSHLVDNKDWKAMLITAAEAFNVPPFEVINMVEDQIVESLQNSEGFELSDDDRQLKRRADEAEYWRNRYQRDQTRTKNQTERLKARAELDGVAEKYGMVDEFGKVNNDLVLESFDSLVKGGIEKDAITANMIGEYHFAKERSQKISGVLKEVAPELEGEEFSEALTMLTTELVLEDISDAQALEMVREVYGKSNTRAISEKVRRGSNINPESPNKPVSPANDPMFFDDINDY